MGNGYGWQSLCHKGFDDDTKKSNLANAACKSLGHKDGVFETPKSDKKNIGVLGMTCEADK